MSLVVPVANPKKASVRRSVFRLLRLRILIWYGEFRRGSIKRKLGYGILGLLLIAGLALAFMLSRFLLGILNSAEFNRLIGSQPDLLESIPVLIVTATFIGVLMTSFGVLLQVLYLAGDMDFLLTAPIPTRAVFIFKLLQAILPNFSLTLLFGLPVLFGLGASAGYNLLYYPLVLIMLSGLALAAAGLSSLLVMAIVRIFPARRVAEVLGFLVGLLSFVCSQSGQLTNYAELAPQQAGQVFRLTSNLNSDWSPLAWAGRGLVFVGEGHWTNGIGLFGLSLGLSLVIFLISLVAAENLYLAGWTNVQSIRPKRKVSRRTTRISGRGLSLTKMVEISIPQVLRGIVIKDFLVLRRDLRNLSNLVMPLIFGVVYTVMLLRSGGEASLGRGAGPEWFNQAARNFNLYANVGISLFVSWSLVSRLALMSFSQEGQNYWVLRSAPVSTFQLMTAKLLVAYLPGLVLGWVFILVMYLARPGGLSVLVFSLLVVALCNAGIAGINLGFGIAGANFTWDDPRRMAGGISGCLGAIVSGLCLALSLLFFFAPVLFLPTLGVSQLLSQLIGLGLGGVLSLVCMVVPISLVRNRVPRLGES